ncbi:Endoribonuclease Dicer like protein 1 [Nosema granulosis]|uniref:Endoribonuclease Dicer like protein 1 n=1 Tax=Nosema granulosis TaxID=83296 RepID=A0A9P6L0E9_9MICR|nr:Endoribonuclease Dicer like protein 1 [Nosema granulosis]
MKIIVNKIYEDKEGEDYTKVIENLYNATERVLFIKDERDDTNYNIENIEMASLKYFSLMKKLNSPKCVIPATKFTLLAWQGFISSTNYDLIIIRLLDLKPEFIHSFRIFYFKTDVMCLEKPKVLTFLKTIKDGANVYLQSIIDENYTKHSSPDKNDSGLRCISCIPFISQGVLNYIKVRNVVKEKKKSSDAYKKIDDFLVETEKKSLEKAIEYINKQVDLSKLSAIEVTKDMLNMAKQLLKTNEHKRIIERFLKEGNVVLHTKIFDFKESQKLFDIKKTSKDKIRDISTLSTLIIVDEIPKEPKCEDCGFNESFLKMQTKDMPDEVKIVPIDVDLNYEHTEEIEYDEKNKCFIHEILNFRFKNVIYVKDEEEYPVDFMRNVMMSNKRDLKGFIKYCAKDRDEYITHTKGAVVAKDFSLYFLEHVLYLINKCFERHFMFFNSPKAVRSFENSEDGSFICVLELPRFADTDVFNMKIRSKSYVLKKDACKEATFLALIKLHENGYLDDNFCPIEHRFIHQNALYFERIKNIYGIDSKDLDEIFGKINEILPTYNSDLSIALEKFKKSHYIDLKEPVKYKVSIDDILRKQPECFKTYGEEFCIYKFGDSGIGLACSGGFDESLSFKSVKIDYIYTTKFTDRERELLIFYQIVFFSINFKRIINIQSKEREYCYFMLPMVDRSINFEYIESLYTKFLLGSVYEIKDENMLKNYLLFNPIARTFHNFINSPPLKLTDFVSNSHYEKISKGFKKDKPEEMPYVERGVSYTANINKKIKIEGENVILDECLEIDDSKEFKKKVPTKKYTYYEYFRKLYGIELVNLVDDRNIIITASVYCSKERQRSTEVHSGEVLFVTAVKDTIKQDYQNFLNYFNIFEHCAVANEFRRDMNLNVSLEAVANALSQSEVTSEAKTDLGYERLEFIGDSVLKFSISKFLFIERGYNLSRIVSTKDNLINNSYLYTVAQEMNLQKYISLIKFSENMFQPPAIKKCKELKDENNKLNKYIESLKGTGAFKNNNQEYFAVRFNQKQTPESKNITGKKVYADIIEALIGVHYVEEGYDAAWEYIKSIGIPDLVSKEKTEVEKAPLLDISKIADKEELKMDPIRSCKSLAKVKDLLSILGYTKADEIPTTPISQEKHYLICAYENILSLSKAEKIEHIIGYKFKNIGLLEKAVIHPSYRNNIFGSEKFQKLELVGDCFLDLKVSDYIYKTYTNANPCDLHTFRKSFVNNYTFATILFKSGLSDLIETGLSGKHVDFDKQRVSKVYSDIFEAIAGAVVLDNDFCLEKTNDFFLKMLVLMKENARDC